MAKREIKITILGDASQLGRTFGKAAAESKGFGSAVKGSVAGAMGGVKTAVGYGSAAVGVGLVAGFYKALKSAGDFEQTLNVFGVTANATTGEMKSVSAAAIKLGNDAKLPGTSATDAATAMLELAKGGLSAKEAMDAARGTLQLSAAAQIDNATAAQIVSDNLNVFALKGTEASRVADLLAASANATTASMPEMADALKQSAAVAAQFNIPIEDTVTMLSELANAGIKGSDAGTSVKTMLLSLAGNSPKAKKAIRELGLSVFDANGKFIGMSDTTAKYAEAMKGMSDEQKIATLKTIFGTDAIRAANVILGQGSTAFQKMKESVTEVGAAQKLSEAQTKGFNGAMLALKSAIGTVALVFGTKLLPASTSALNFLTDHIPTIVSGMSAMAGWASRNGELFRTLAILVGVATGALVTYKIATIAVGVAQTIWKAISVAIMVARNAQLALNLAMTANPIGLVIAAVALLTAGIIVAYRHSATFRAIVDGAFRAVKAAAVSALGWITGSGIPALKSAWNSAGGVVKVVSAIISAHVAVIRAVVTTAVKIVGSLLRGDWSGAWNAAKGAVSKLVSAISSTLARIPGILGSAARSAGSGARGIGAAIIQGIAGGISAGWGYLTGLVGNLASSLLNKAKGILHINSPSKVFADVIGRAIPEGIALGVDAHAATAHDAVGRLSGGLLDSAVLDGTATRGAGTGPGSRSGSIEVHVHVAGSVQTERDLVRSVIEGVKEAARRQGSVLPAASVGRV